MSKPDLAAIRERDRRGALGLSLLRIADEGLLDRKALLAYVEQLEAQLDAVRALVGPENESGMISASAIFHTIGTNNQGDNSE